MKKLLIIISLTFVYLTPKVEQIRLGSTYGGWAIPKNLLNKNSICYCAGVGEDITFDIELINHFGCTVFSFDPTPRAIEHINNLKTSIEKQEPYFSVPDHIPYNTSLVNLKNLHFYPFGIFNKDTILKFYVPRDPNHVSHSIVNLQKTDNYFKAECFSIPTLMKKFGHKKIDLLKLDIEGAEIDVINDILEKKVDIKCICIEFDELVGANLKSNQHNLLIKNKVNNTIKKIIHAGYSLIFRKAYESLTFLRK